MSCNSHKVTAMASRNHCKDDALLSLAFNGSGVNLACTARVAAIAKGSSVKRNTVVTDRCEAQEEKPDGMYVVDIANSSSICKSLDPVRNEVGIAQHEMYVSLMPKRESAKRATRAIMPINGLLTFSSCRRRPRRLQHSSCGRSCASIPCSPSSPWPPSSRRPRPASS